MKNRFILVADTSDALLGTLKEELENTAYALLHAKDGQEAIDYLDLLKSDAEVTGHVKPKALEALFDDAYHTKHVETIFRRVFGAS